MTRAIPPLLKSDRWLSSIYDETPAVLMTQNDIDGLFWEGNKETNAAFTFHLNTSDLFYCIRLSNTQTEN